MLISAPTHELAPDLAVHEQAHAIAEARRHVVTDLVIASVFVAAAFVIGMPDQRAAVLPAFLSAGLLSAYDVVWWLWLRTAEPLEAFRRLQARSAKGG